MKRANTNGWKSLDSLAEDFLSAKAAKKVAEAEYNSLKSTIVNKMDGQLLVETDRYIIQYVNNERQILDIDRLKTERPELYLHYLKSQDYWTLGVNERTSSTRIA